MTKFALKNNVLTYVLLAVLVFTGIQTYYKLPQDSMPPFTVRFVSIVASYPGASPERVELLISDKIEKALQQVSELKSVDSESRTGIAIVGAEIKSEYTDMRPIYDKIRRKIDGIKHELPEGTYIQIKDEDLVDVFGIIYSISGDGYTPAELYDVAKTMKDGLIKLPNAAKITIVGEQEEQIFIDYDNAKFGELGITPERVKNIIGGSNIIFPGGDMTIGNENLVLEPTGNFESLEQLKKTIVSTTKNGTVIYLGDIANVYRGYKSPIESIVRVNGQQSIALGIKLKDGGNIVELGKETDELMRKFESIYPWGLEIRRTASQDKFVEKSVSDFITNLFQSIVTVLVVMLLFLGLRTGIVVSALIPAVIVVTFMIMKFVDVGLNQISLAGLIMALGMLVDNAIVMAESIMVKLERGKTKLEASIESANELKIPLLISSLTTSAAFLSFYLAESIMGEIVGQLFVVITIALLSSWVLALTLIPLLGMKLIKVKPKQVNPKPNAFDKILNVYKPFLMWNLKRPVFLLVAVFGLLIGSVKVIGLLPSIFMPDSERPLVTANFALPMTTSIDFTTDMIVEIEDYLQKFIVKEEGEEGIVDLTSFIGEGAPKYDLGYVSPEKSSFSAHILINTTSDVANQIVIDSLDKFCFNNFPDLTPTIKRLNTAGGASNPIQVRVSGKDPKKLFELVNKVKANLAAIPGTKDIGDNWGLRTKKMIVDIDQTKAQLSGINNADVAISMQTYLTGKTTGQFRDGDKTLSIIMVNKSEKVKDLESLKTLDINSQQSGDRVPLSQIADLKMVWQPTRIMRKNLARTVTVSCNVATGKTAAEVQAALEPLMNEEVKSWAAGYSFEYGGEKEGSAEGLGSVAAYLPLSFFIIILLLVAQFNSLKKPLIILLTIPLGAIGVFFGLYFANSYMGFFAILGLISLAGVVINNGIVLLDRIDIELNENNKTPQDAIILAAQERFRPILLTTATTICGLIPLWLGGGILFEPLAVGMLFGLVFATVLTLVFVPVMYKIFYRVSYKNV